MESPPSPPKNYNPSFVPRPDLSDGTVECLHFRHEHVIAVRGLGGHCYKMDDDIENEDHADDGEPTKIGERKVQYGNPDVNIMGILTYLKSCKLTLICSAIQITKPAN